jgi:hypothetical protein
MSMGISESSTEIQIVSCGERKIEQKEEFEQQEHDAMQQLLSKRHE